jgi:hypothetical protein
MIEKCDVEGCAGLPRDTEAKTCQSTIHWVKMFGEVNEIRKLCPHHEWQWQCLQVQLPLAIQEFHAWTLAYSEAFRHPVSSKLPAQAVAAQKLVCDLRALERKLKGL